MQVKVEGRVLIVDVSPNDTAQSVKRRVAESESIDTQNMSLWYLDHELDDDVVLQENKVYLPPDPLPCDARVVGGREVDATWRLADGSTFQVMLVNRYRVKADAQVFLGDSELGTWRMPPFCKMYVERKDPTAAPLTFRAPEMQLRCVFRPHDLVGGTCSEPHLRAVMQQHGYTFRPKVVPQPIGEGCTLHLKPRVARDAEMRVAAFDSNIIHATILNEE